MAGVMLARYRYHTYNIRVVAETIARVFPPHWCTRRGSHNREVTRVKKDVRVNLARSISGDELIPLISPGLLSPSVSVSFRLPFSLLRLFSLLLLLLLRLLSCFSSLGSLSRNVPSACFLPRVPPTLVHPSFWTALFRSFLAARQRRVSLYLWRT